MAKQEQKKGKGCLVAIGVILTGIIGLYLYGLTIEPNETPLQKFFKENKLGQMENIRTQEQGSFERIDFFANGIDYIVYVDKETKIIDKIYTTTLKGFPIYDKSKNDTVLDEREKSILNTKRHCFNQVRTTFKGEIREITKDLKSRTNYPKTFKLENVDTYDMGTYLIQNITYTTKNTFGVPIEGHAKYKVDFETNKLQLIDIN